MTKRALELYEKARKELSGPVDNDLLKAMAVMVDAAMPAKKEPSGVGKANWVAGMQIINRLKYTAPSAVIWEPTSRSTVSMAGANARDAKLTEEDIELLAAWLRDGGLDWMREKPTFQYIARSIVDLVARAKGSRPYTALPKDDALDKLRESGDL